MSTLTFLTEFIRDPVTLGAVAPSGPSLARLIVESADIQPGHVVVELGAGTGPMTAQLKALHPDNPLLSLEPKAALAKALRARFPDVAVREDYVQKLPELLEALPRARSPDLRSTACRCGAHNALPARDQRARQRSFPNSSSVSHRLPVRMNDHFSTLQNADR